MPKLSKRMRAIREKVEVGKVYSLQEAVALLKSLPPVKFRESVDISVNLGIDSRKSDQIVRGSIVLPHGTGRNVKVAVFTNEANFDMAKKAGADVVGLDDLAEQVKSGQMDFNIVVATPDAMKVVGKLGQVLGPRGLMPNPKDGTVTDDLETAITNAKAGQVKYRTDKAGIVHTTVGKVDFKEQDLIENISRLVAALKKAKPASAKGVYLKKITLSTTMGAGIAIDISSIDA